MIVLKFGGTSLRDAASLRRVVEIVGARLDDDPLVVVSAHAGVTDALEALALAAVQGEADASALTAKHAAILGDLELEADLHDAVLRELVDLVRGIGLVGELSPRSRDAVLSFGERLSSLTVAAALRASGIMASAVNAVEAGLCCEPGPGRPRLLPDEGRLARYLAGVEGVAVLTGFIAADQGGDPRTLGRNGSDLSATFAGHALGADEVQVWTDVDGVLTADPRIVDEARPIPRMSYDEAAELANQGARVLHPAALAPAIAGRITVRVLNTHEPSSPGTLIVPVFDEPDVVVRCIAHKRHVTLVNVESSGMVAQAGFLARIFRVFESQGISVDLVTTSEVSVSVTLDNTENLDAAADELGAFSRVDVVTNLAHIGVIGHGIRHRAGVPARVLGSLERAGIEVRMVSLGALKVNVSLVVGQDDLVDAVRVLHTEFFGS